MQNRLQAAEALAAGDAAKMQEAVAEHEAALQKAETEVRAAAAAWKNAVAMVRAAAPKCEELALEMGGSDAADAAIVNEPSSYSGVSARMQRI